MTEEQWALYVRRKFTKRARALQAFYVRGRAKREQKWRRAALEKAFRRVVASPQPGMSVSLLYGAAASVAKKYHSRQRAKLVRALRRRLENATKQMKLGGKSEKAREWLGCTLEEFRTHLERQFEPGMTWENHGYEGWHLDHVKPVISFDLADPAQCRACFHYTNFQPLWAKENLAKGRKLLCEPSSGVL